MSDNQSDEQQPSNNSEAITLAVFDQLKSYLDAKIESISSGLKQATTSQSTKFERQAEAQKLKFSGNKDQFIFNAEVQNLIEATTDFIRKRDYDEALAKATEADTLLKQRQKKIKLADKSEAGWLAVKEYETEELASDSDDEQRIRKAQKSALQKRRQNALKQDKVRKATSTWSSTSGDTRSSDRTFFRGTLDVLSL